MPLSKCRVECLATLQLCSTPIVHLNSLKSLGWSWEQKPPLFSFKLPVVKNDLQCPKSSWSLLVLEMFLFLYHSWCMHVMHLIVCYSFFFFSFLFFFFLFHMKLHFNVDSCSSALKKKQLAWSLHVTVPQARRKWWPGALCCLRSNATSWLYLWVWLLFHVLSSRFDEGDSFLTAA